LRVGVLVAAALAIGVPSAYGVSSTLSPKQSEKGKKLYKKYCGQCHALKAARALGQGSGAKLGPGEEGGPSFDTLRVTALQSKLAVTGVWDGHAKIMTQMTYPEINLVSKWIEITTKKHPHKATMPSDAFHISPGK
jgi:mono/diheme cytochrome c family protein